MNKNSKIVVFGASGLVGSAIIRKLVEKGYSNIIGTIHKRKPSIPYPLSLIPLNLTNQSAVENFFKDHKPEYVFLAAAKVGGILANNTYKADFIYDNMAIALNVINSAYKFGVKKLLNLGSSCIYPRNCPQPMKEEYLLTGSLESTNEPYAIAKISAIKLCRYFNEQYSTNFISTMPTNLYGPNDNFNLETAHVLPALIRKFHLGKLLMENEWQEIINDLKKTPIGFGFDKKISFDNKNEIKEILEKIGINENSITVWGSGEVYREFLYVDDLADGCVYLMENIEAEKMRELSQDYFVNIGTGEDIKLKELFYLVKEVIGYKGNISHDLSKPDGTPKKLLDVKKINQLGWKANISLEEGIRKMYEWYLNRDMG